jgi:hypothetical protein
MPWIARFVVVGADENSSARHHRSRVSFSAELCAPLDIPAGGRVELGWQPAFIRHEIAGPSLAPLRLISCEQRTRDEHQGDEPDDH